MNLKKLRTDKHISLIGVSEDINLHRDTLSKIEKGMSDLPTRCIKRLSELYGTTPEIIISSHEKDIEEYSKKCLLGQLEKAQFFLKSNDRKSVLMEAN